MSGRDVASRLEGPLGGIDRLLLLVVRLVWLNLCWTGLTLLGGVLLGFGPATVAAHVVATRWLRGERDLAIGATMWAQWRLHFRSASASTLLAAVLTGSLAVTWWLGRQQAALPGGVSQALSTIGLLLMAALLPHLVWVIERTRQSPSRNLLTALAVGLGRPLLTLALLIIAIGWPVGLTLIGWPGLLPVCGVSVPVLAAAWCIQRVFPAADRSNTAAVGAADRPSADPAATR